MNPRNRHHVIRRLQPAVLVSGAVLTTIAVFLVGWLTHNTSISLLLATAVWAAVLTRLAHSFAERRSAPHEAAERRSGHSAAANGRTTPHAFAANGRATPHAFAANGRTTPHAVAANGRAAPHAVATNGRTTPHAAVHHVADTSWLDALPDTALLIDGNGTILDCRGRPLAGDRIPRTLAGHRLTEVFPSETADRLHRAVRRVIESGEAATLEYVLDPHDLLDGCDTPDSRDGLDARDGQHAREALEARDVPDAVNAREAPDVRVAPRHQEARIRSCDKDHAVAIIRDVTERESAERSIREAESKFRILVEQSLTGIYILQEGRFVYVNPRFADVFGYTIGEVLRSDNLSDLVTPDVVHDGRPFDDAADDGGTHFTVRRLRKDRSVVHAEVFRSVIEYRGKQAVVGTVLDVTEQREAQEKLRVLGMAVEQSAEGVLVIDTAGIVRFVNPAWARMHGYSVDEVTGHHFRIFHTEEQLRREVFPAINRFEKMSIYRAEMGHVRKDGTTFMSSTAFASLRDSTGRVIGAVGICRDITEQKDYEADLLQAKEAAEELSRLKTAFLTNMSHEIRTPLTGILGFARILEEEVKGEQSEFVQLIRSSGDRLMNTLNAILDLARLEAGEMTLHPDDLDVVEEVTEAAILFHALARDKNVEFSVEMPSREIDARLDSNTLDVILNNLIGNAVKFTNEGSVTVAVRADERVVDISVSDTGVGIDPDFLPHLFDAFKQESDGLTRTHEGSGLGLAITKRLVELSGGEIRVESTKGFGTHFHVRLPRYADRPPLSNVA